MNVVVHQHIGMDGAAEKSRQLLKLGKIKVPIVLREEAVAPVVSSLHDMRGNSGEQCSKASRHAHLTPVPLRTPTWGSDP